ncbi:MAG: hypothetical protein AB7P52_11780 [Alphaproteobacteria bacterium]
MRPRKEQTAIGSADTTAAANVDLFLRTVRGAPGPEAAPERAASPVGPVEAIVAVLRAGPKSFPDLMRESQLAFGELDDALDRLEKRGLVASEGEGEALRYRLTAAGEALP